MRSAFGNLIYLLVILSMAAGCMHNPYVNRMVVEEDGQEAKKFFAYGNFCGAGHPVLTL